MLEIDVDLSDEQWQVLEKSDWDYDKSVKKVRQLVVNWKNISIEIMRELYIARQKLSAQGRRTDLQLSCKSNKVSVSWNQYLDDVGLNYHNVRRWLQKYDFEKDELVTFETTNLPQEVEGEDYLPTEHKCPNCGYEY